MGHECVLSSHRSTKVQTSSQMSWGTEPNQRSIHYMHYTLIKLTVRETWTVVCGGNYSYLLFACQVLAIDKAEQSSGSIATVNTEHGMNQRQTLWPATLTELGLGGNGNECECKAQQFEQFARAWRMRKAARSITCIILSLIQLTILFKYNCMCMCAAYLCRLHFNGQFLFAFNYSYAN